MSAPISSSKAIRIGIVAGEASGDILGAGLIRSLKQLYPNAQFEGIAGPTMQQLGCRSLFDMEELSVMGLVEVLSRLRRLLFVRKSLLEHFSNSPPDVFIGIDAPDFNLGLEARLKKTGIKTVHYVSPSVWAWREKRIHKIAKATNMVLSLFPFEKAFYDKHQVPCQFVGHTLADEMPLEPKQKEARAKLELNADDNILAILPGSRNGEVAMLLEPFLTAAVLLSKEINRLKVLIPVVNKARKQQVESYVKQHHIDIDVRIVFGHSREVMSAANAVLLASGTATLEAMLCKKPMVVCYRFKALTYRILKLMVKAPYFSLPNLLAGEKLVPELLQNEVTGENLKTQLKSMFVGDNSSIVARFSELHNTLKQGADQQAALTVSQLIEGKL